MDEYKNNLRVATTSSVYTTRGSYEYNNVFVLDSGMKTIGSLTHIAEQEKIYSTRFIGDRLYMVTFKRIDPFFVIDLSTPASPKILGKLKIPGYSDYLHPYDATHIIGVGKETGTNDWGGVSTKGSSSPSSMSPMLSTRPRSTKWRSATPARTRQRSRTTRRSSSTRQRTCS